MRLVKLGLVLLAVFFPLGRASAFTFEPKLGKIGLGLPTCNATSKNATQYKTSDCFGLHLSYVEYNTNLVLAYDQAAIELNDPYLKKYELATLHLGYRFDFGNWIKYFWDKEVYILSSIYITGYFSGGLLNFFSFGQQEDKEKITTSDRSFTSKQPNTSIYEFGFQINESWDIFMHMVSSEKGPFFLRTPDGLKKEQITVNAVFFGAHYSF